MLQANLQRIRRDLGMYLGELPPALIGAGVDALIVDEIALTGPAIAELLRLPWFIISTSIPHNLGWKAYPWWTGYRASRSMVATLQNVLLENSVFRVRGPIRYALEDWRRRNGLRCVRDTANHYPSLAQITPLPECLDLPRRKLPRNFYYTAPFVQEARRASVPFPWERLNDRPLIYVTLGTTHKLDPRLFRIIAEGCAGLDVQLVISLGNRLEAEQLRGVPGDPVIVRFAPQLEILRRARAVITHAGLNTVSEALLEGKPIVAIPLAYDQPTIARRLERLGIAEVLPVARLSAERVRAAVAGILKKPGYAAAAANIRMTLRNLRGPERAADVIEERLAAHAGPGAWLGAVQERSCGPCC